MRIYILKTSATLASGVCPNKGGVAQLSYDYKISKFLQITERRRVMAISKNQISEKRTKLELQKQKDELKLKAIQERLKKAEQKIQESFKQEDQDRKKIIGEFIFQKRKQDPSFKIWLDGEIHSHLKNDYEKKLFGVLKEEKMEKAHELT